MTAKWLDVVGDRNPQLFRELKGRLKWRSALLVGFVALLGQFSLGGLLFEYDSNPVPVFQMCNWLLPLLLLVPGTVMLMTDLEQEERQGTLNFIRLSPQTSQSILLGKLLGVPILLYLGAALLVPLHIWSTIASQVSLGFLVSFYGLLGVACAFVFSLALLSAFLGRFSTSTVNAFSSASTLFATFFVGVAFLPIYIYWNQLTVWRFFLQGQMDPSEFIDMQWFFLPISENLAIAHGFTLLNAGLAIYWVWHVLNRCFCSPTSALLSKCHSYFMTAHIELLMLGFLVQISGSLNAASDWFAVLLCVCLANLIWFGVLMVLLSPQGQVLLDWARYRHSMSISASGGRRALIADLLGGDKSPALVAMLFNFSIVAAMLSAWVLLGSTAALKLRLLVGLVLSFTLLTIYAAIAQFAALAKSRQQTLQVAVAIGGVALLPPLIWFLAAQGEPTRGKELLLFTPFLWIVLENVSKTAIALSLMGQWSLLGLLGYRFTQKLEKLGASETKALLSASSAMRPKPQGAG
jgi:hypothetical protein